MTAAELDDRVRRATPVVRVRSLDLPTQQSPRCRLAPADIIDVSYRAGFDEAGPGMRLAVEPQRSWAVGAGRLHFVLYTFAQPTENAMDFETLSGRDEAGSCRMAIEATDDRQWNGLRQPAPDLAARTNSKRVSKSEAIFVSMSSKAAARHGAPKAIL